VVEWKDLSDVGRTGAKPVLLILVFCIVIVSSSMTHPQQSRKIMGNHAAKLITFAFNIFCSCKLLSVEFMFTIDHKALFYAKSCVVFSMGLHVCMKL